MEQHIIVGMEFKLMLCQAGSKVFGQEELLIDTWNGRPGRQRMQGR
jgi:hypothetical protein